MATAQQPNAALKVRQRKVLSTLPFRGMYPPG